MWLKIYNYLEDNHIFLWQNFLPGNADVNLDAFHNVSADQPNGM